MSQDEVLIALLTRVEKRLEFIVKVEIIQSIIIALLFTWLFTLEVRVGHSESAIKIEQSISNDSKQEHSSSFTNTDKRNVNGVELEGLNNNGFKHN